MKIDSNGLNPIAPKKTEGAQAADKKPATRESARTSSIQGKDRAELSESARLLAKARVSFDELNEEESARLETLKKQIEDGTYSVPVEDLARRMLARLYPKE